MAFAKDRKENVSQFCCRKTDGLIPRHGLLTGFMTRPAKEKELQPLANAQVCQRKQVNAWIREAVSDSGWGQTDGAVVVRRPTRRRCCVQGGALNHIEWDNGSK